MTHKQVLQAPRGFLKGNSLRNPETRVVCSPKGQNRLIPPLGFLGQSAPQLHLRAVYRAEYNGETQRLARARNWDPGVKSEKNFWEKNLSPLALPPKKGKSPPNLKIALPRIIRTPVLSPRTPCGNKSSVKEKIKGVSLLFPRTRTQGNWPPPVKTFLPEEAYWGHPDLYPKKLGESLGEFQPFENWGSENFPSGPWVNCVKKRSL